MLIQSSDRSFELQRTNQQTFSRNSIGSVLSNSMVHHSQPIVSFRGEQTELKMFNYPEEPSNRDSTMMSLHSNQNHPDLIPSSPNLRSTKIPVSSSDAFKPQFSNSPITSPTSSTQAFKNRRPVVPRSKTGSKMFIVNWVKDNPPKSSSNPLG